MKSDNHLDEYLNFNNFNYIINEAAGRFDPNEERRDYDLSSGLPLIGLLDTPMYPPFVMDTNHYHNCMEIGVCLKGEGTISIGNRGGYNYGPGTVIIIPKGVFHTQQNSGLPMTHWRYILINQEALVQEASDRNRPKVKKMLEDMAEGVYMSPGNMTAEAWSTIETMYRLFYKRGTLDCIELESLVYLMLALLSEIPNAVLDNIPFSSEPRNVIDPSLRFVSEQFTQEIRIADMAACCAMSESNYRKTFERIMGMSPLEYLNRYRISKSINLLRDTNETVWAIAGRTGFPSIATFNRNFQKYVGMAPAEWRKKTRYR